MGPHQPPPRTVGEQPVGVAFFVRALDNDAEIARQIEKLMPWLRETLSLATVWGCEEVGQREFSVEEVEAIMREWSPKEFET